MKNNLTLNPSNKTKAAGVNNLFSSQASPDISMMDIEIPACSNTGSGVPPQNLFGSFSNDIGTNSSTNLFCSSNNKIGPLGSTNPFGSSDNKISLISIKNHFASVSGSETPFTNNQFGERTQLRQSDNPFNKTSKSANPFSTTGSSGVFVCSSRSFSDNSLETNAFSNKLDSSKGVKFSLGSISRPVRSKRRRIVRRRRTLKLQY